MSCGGPPLGWWRSGLPLWRERFDDDQSSATARTGDCEYAGLVICAPGRIVSVMSWVRDFGPEQLPDPGVVSTGRGTQFLRLGLPHQSRNGCRGSASRHSGLQSERALVEICATWPCACHSPGFLSDARYCLRGGKSHYNLTQRHSLWHGCRLDRHFSRVFVRPFRGKARLVRAYLSGGCFLRIHQPLQPDPN